MTTPFGGTDAETRQGVAAADAARQQACISSSRPSAPLNRQTGVPHFDSKYEVEKHITKIGVAQRFSRPLPSWRNLYFIKELTRERDLRSGTSSDKSARASCRRGHRGGRRPRLEDCARFTGKRSTSRVTNSRGMTP